jgi:hypothetical protein
MLPVTRLGTWGGKERVELPVSQPLGTGEKGTAPGELLPVPRLGRKTGSAPGEPRQGTWRGKNNPAPGDPSTCRRIFQALQPYNSL